MSLPRRRAEPRGSFQAVMPAQSEPDHTVVMPAISKLREAGDDVFAIEDALDAIPRHILPRVAVFASRRPELLPPAGLDLLLTVADIAAAGSVQANGREKNARRGAATK